MNDSGPDGDRTANWYIERVRENMTRQNAEKALELCDAGLAEWRYNPKLWQAKVQILVRLGQFPEAMKVINDTSAFSRKARETPVFQMRAFEVYLEQGDITSARARRDEIARLDPDLGPHYLMAVAKLGLATGAHVATLKVLEPRLGDFPYNVQLRLMAARHMAACGRAGEALALIDSCLAKKPNDELLVFYAQIVLNEGRTEDADRFLMLHEDRVRQSPRLLAEKVRALERNGGHARALELVQGALKTYPRNPLLNTMQWRLVAATGDPDAAAALSVGYARQDDSSVRAALAAVRFHFLIGRHDEGEALLREVYEKHPDNLLVTLRAANSELDQKFDPETALRLLEASGAERLNDPVFAKIRAKSLRQMGFVPEAIAILEKLRTEGDLDEDGMFQLIRFRVMVGDFDVARMLLDTMEYRSSDARQKKYAILADIAFEHGDLSAARRNIFRAIVLRNRDGSHLDTLAKYQMHGGDYRAAWENHAASIERLFDRQLDGEATNKPIKSLMGQLLNEYRLFCGERDDFGPRWDADRQEKARLFYRGELATSPGSTPAAMGVLSALRRTGHVTEAPPRAAPGAAPDNIPKVVYQFWDKPDPPQQVAAVMDWNRRLNPDYEFRCYNYQTAQAYFREKNEAAALRAFRLSPHVAGKADVFRLVVLWHEGGVYLDADDRVAAPFSGLLDHSLRFTGYQEPYWTVGNNFMAVQPNDPIIRAALDDAIEAFEGPLGASVWLSSGPGAITRALALHGTDQAGCFKDGVWVMPQHKMHGFLIPHIRMSYKTSDVHWIRQLQKRDS